MLCLSEANRHATLHSEATTRLHTLVKGDRSPSLQPQNPADVLERELSDGSQSPIESVNAESDDSVETPSDIEPDIDVESDPSHRSQTGRRRFFARLPGMQSA